MWQMCSTEGKEMILKIKRNEYTITEKDRFLDNGVCVQLLTQSKERGTWGGKPYPVLSKRAVAEIDKYERINEVENNFHGMKSVTFSLSLSSTTTTSTGGGKGERPELRRRKKK